MCPGNNESAGKHFNGRTRKGDPWLRGALGEAAAAAARTRTTHLGERYRRLVRRRGKKRALVAIGHSILICAWHILMTDTDYRETRADPSYALPTAQTRRRAGRLATQLQALGYRVTLEAAT